MTHPIKLGIVGAGLAVKKLHWPALQRLTDRYQFVAVADVDATKAAATADMIGAPRTTTDYRELLAMPDVEAVLLSLPIHLTATIALEAARAGKHIIMEKPIGSNLEQARMVRDQLAPLPITVLVAENYRYRTDIRQARDLIRSGRIGEPIVMRINSLSQPHTDDPDDFSSTPWRHDAQYRGGSVLDAGVHHAAALRELMGDVEWVQAFAKYGNSALNGPTTMSINLRFRSGALGTYLYSVACHDQQSPFVEMVVYGTTGTLEISQQALRILRRDQEPEQIEVDGSDNGYVGEFLNFYEAIRNGAPVVATLDQSYRDMELILRALDAAEAASVVLL